MERLRSPLEPGVFVELAAGITIIERDERTRAARQKAAMLTGTVVNNDWPINANAEYIVAKLSVSPRLVDDPMAEAFRHSYRVDRLFPSPAEDRLLAALLAAGVKGLEADIS
jgi:hypothetical protein